MGVWDMPVRVPPDDFSHAEAEAATRCSLALPAATPTQWRPDRRLPSAPPASRPLASLSRDDQVVQARVRGWKKNLRYSCLVHGESHAPVQSMSLRGRAIAYQTDPDGGSRFHGVVSTRRNLFDRDRRRVGGVCCDDGAC